MSFQAIKKKNGVSISNRYPEVHKRGIHTQTHTHIHTHDDGIRRNAMHCISPKKLVEYRLDQYVIKWVLSFLSDRTQFPKVGTKISGMKAINLSIVQGSGVVPCLFIIFIADLRPAEPLIVLLSMPKTLPY